MPEATGDISEIKEDNVFNFTDEQRYHISLLRFYLQMEVNNDAFKKIINKVFMDFMEKCNIELQDF